MVKVSVIIPVYNVEPYLRECLNSVINQTLKNIEIICIDDSSTDNSLEILQEYAAKDQRFKIITQQNQGQGIARNKGIDLAQGEYIQFIDPDDWVETDMLEKLYSFANKKSANVVRFNHSVYNNYSGKLKKSDFAKQVKNNFNYDLTQTPYYNWRELKSGCLTDLGLWTWTYFYNANFIKDNDIRFAPGKHSEDHLFANGAILLAPQVDFLNEYLYFYRIRPGSACNTQSDNHFCIFGNIELLRQFIIDHSLYDELKDEFQRYSQTVLGWHWRSIPKKSLRRYKVLCRKYFTRKEFKKFVHSKSERQSLVKNIFSIRNSKSKTHKVITIFWLKIKIKRKRPQLYT